MSTAVSSRVCVGNPRVNLPNRRVRGIRATTVERHHTRARICVLATCEDPSKDRLPAATSEVTHLIDREAQIHRRKLLLSGAALTSLAGVSTSDWVLGSANAHAAEEPPVVWDGVGRRPVAIITGANTGIGKAEATELVMRGWDVTLACRNASKAEAAAQDIRLVTGCQENQVQTMVLDLADLRSVRDFAAKWEESGKEVDALIANAGVMAVYPQQFTADGFELTMAVNHLGHFLLVCLLEPAIRAGSVNGSSGGRVVSTSSLAHNFTNRVDLQDPFYQNKPYKRWDAYGQSKLANILFARELDSRCQQIDNCGVTAYSFHPGVVATDLIRYIVPEAVMTDMVSNRDRSLWVSTHLFGLKTPADGASTGIYLATSKEVAALHSEYFDESKVGVSSRGSKDMDAAAKLWQYSLDVTGAPQDAWTA